MQKSNRLPALVILGLVAVIGATASRRYVAPPLRQIGARTSAPQISAPPTSMPLPPDQAAVRSQETKLRVAAAAHPDDRGAHWALANFYMEAKQKPEAVAQLDVITRLGPSGPGEALALANLRLLLRQYPQAEVLYHVAARRPQDALQAWQGLSTTLYAQNRFWEAMQAAQRAVQARPTDPGSRFLLASATLEYGAQFSNLTTQRRALAQARDGFQKLAAVPPGNTEVYDRLGKACLLLQDWNGAVAALRRALALSPRPETYARLAQAEKGVSDTAAAQDALEKGLARYPASADLHDLHGQMLQSGTQPAEAGQDLAEFQKAVALRPKNERYLEHEGAALVRAGRLPEARTAFEEAARLDPTRPFPPQQLAVIWTRLGDAQKARQADQTAAALVFNAQQLHQVEFLSGAHPGSVPLRLILADRYLALGQRGAARDEYLQAASRDPGNAHVRQRLATLQEATH